MLTPPRTLPLPPLFPPLSESTMANGGTVSLRLSRLIRVGGTQAARQASTRQRRCPPLFFFCGHGQKNKTFHKLEVAYQNVIRALYQLLPNSNRQPSLEKKGRDRGEERRKQGDRHVGLTANGPHCRYSCRKPVIFLSPSACRGIHLH